jgi:glutamate---cysteine ligase / carboxylate-amine ligase
VERLTVGVEEEFHVVDLESGRLVPRADAVVASARPVMGDEVTHELNLCQVETASPVCSDLAEVDDHVRSSRHRLAQAAAGRGLGITAAGTHPSGRWELQQVDRSVARFRDMEDAYQQVAREQIICGCHVHVGFPDADLGVAAMNRLRPWLPVLLALSASSPFWQGTDTGFDSYRHQIWQRWPTAGMPPHFASAAAYQAFVAELVEAGAVKDASYLYWYVRPSARYPTIELRVCDTCVTPEDTVTLVGLSRALAWTCAREAEAGVPEVIPRRELFDTAMWRAARYGLRDRLVSPCTLNPQPARVVVTELIDFVRPGLDHHGDAPRVEAGVNRILFAGNGADRQRRLLAATGDRWVVVDELLRISATEGAAPVADLALPPPSRAKAIFGRRC